MLKTVYADETVGDDCFVRGKSLFKLIRRYNNYLNFIQLQRLIYNA
jgi:hypothetical protein